ncbi:FAD-dependent monooxygenase [Streptomyces drozdowiczii]|uniref:FAD-dependent monooxygenase n=1 Tax=Streptomyces drozdowiczii TaxID=202862 RepID=A0ABY6PLM5_9ACTN|nr:FAD-dependent monooxygenase [Streptomyces drozdowiczii]MCX0247539.1 FAD-dependent monooxygenase [Streptomyces drozdowiczii]UZK53075.1 FAD-dependent monooxygenase [Streptomyces drozdowiczii]
MPSVSPMRVPGRVQVLVAGGGPVGLAAAVELGRRGIDVLVVEPRAAVSHARPRCKTLNVRTMEHLRRWSLAERLRARAPLPPSWSQDVVFCTSLSGRELSRFTGVLGLVPEGDRFPETGQQAPQYVLEEVLREAVEEIAPGRLVLGSKVVGVYQDDESVAVTVDNGTGRRVVVTADYVIGCDGPRSVVRDEIGARYVGGEALRPNFGMVFESPGLWEHVAHGPAVQYWVVNAAAPALVGPLDRTDTWWAIGFGVDRETGEREARRIIDGVAGRPVRAKVLSTDPWTARMMTVDRMRDGRVFLAGDAAHLNPPFGGHGLNTGIGDAVDLGWKLAAVLDGWGGPGILDSYESERRPVQERVIREATANMRVLSTELYADDLDADDEAGARARRAAGVRIQETKKAEFHSLDLVLGLRVADSPVVPAARTLWAGARLPHLFLADGRSLYDVLGAGLTLLALTEDAPVAAVEEAARLRGVPLGVVRLPEPLAAGYAAKLGARLVLVRPDQVVAWLGDEAPEDAVSLIDTVGGGAPRPVHTSQERKHHV